jgi:hypothetical protein
MALYEIKEYHSLVRNFVFTLVEGSRTRVTHIEFHINVKDIKISNVGIYFTSQKFCFSSSAA